MDVYFLDNTCKKSLSLWEDLRRTFPFLVCPCKCSSLETFTIQEDLNYKNGVLLKSTRFKSRLTVVVKSSLRKSNQC